MSAVFPRADYLELQSALHDPVTGLPTLPRLYGTLRAALERHGRVGILHVEALDLDLVESLYGWRVFDRIVHRAADALRGALGQELPADATLAVDGVAGARFLAFVARSPEGGDVEPGWLAAAGAALCRRLDAAFAGDEFAGLSPMPVFRAGRALLTPDPFFRFERRIAAAVAEAARFGDELEQRRERSFAEELRRIIREGDVRAVFQPVVDLASGVVVGFEAFARGPRDTPFELPRVMFAFSDRIGVEMELDRLCLGEALRSAAELQASGTLFVNVRPAALREAAHGNAALAAFGARTIVLELGERTLDPAREGLEHALATLRGTGCKVALGNAGTGARTRDTLARLAFDFVKLDASLVHGVHRNWIQREAVRGLVELAHGAGAAVVAEGIECEAEREALAAAGVALGQGFLFAAPGPVGATRAGARPSVA